jgi:hypothetical protein
MPSTLRPFFAFLSAISLLCAPTLAFQSPLSEESVREAYFLGQRRDESMARFLDKYTKHLPTPKTGPHIASVTLLTPFALLVQESSRHTMGYSAQQAQLDHRAEGESVKIIVEIYLTDSYGAFLTRPTGSRSGSLVGITLRSPDFWRDFRVHVFDKDGAFIPFDSSGEPNYTCPYRGGCTLTGATLEFDFPAEFFSDSATVQIDPPEGDPVILDFDLISLR